MCLKPPTSKGNYINLKANQSLTKQQNTKINICCPHISMKLFKLPVQVKPLTNSDSHKGLTFNHTTTIEIIP